MANALRVKGLSFAYGGTPVLRDVSFTVPAGAFFTLLGPSGCGKTTLLKILGGYLSATSGQCVLQERDISKLPPEERKIGMVFQNYALFPHLTAWKNVAFSLEVRRVPKADLANRVEAQLDRVGLSKEEAQRRPANLSGGQQQRVAIARALVFEPDLLLLDEPLANLDRHLREELRQELRKVHEQSGTTTIMVTHDQDEALAASDIVGVMNHGRLLQVGPPKEVYLQPRTPFVARFLGDANILLDGTMVRPESVQLGGPETGLVLGVAFHGVDQVLQLDYFGTPFKIRTQSRDHFCIGQSVSFAIPDEVRWKIPELDETP